MAQAGSIQTQMRPKRILLTEKKCCVTYCRNNSSDSQELIFFRVPQTDFRLEVFHAIKVATGVRPTYSMTKAAVYVCESHYKLDDDVEHWERCNPETSAGIYPIKLKKGVLPHIFSSPKQDFALESTSSDEELEVFGSGIEVMDQVAAQYPNDEDLRVPFSQLPNFALPMSIRSQPHISLSTGVKYAVGTDGLKSVVLPVDKSSSQVSSTSPSTSRNQGCSPKLRLTEQASETKTTATQYSVESTSNSQISCSRVNFRCKVTCECKAARHSRHDIQSHGFDSPMTSSSQNTASPAKSIPDSEYVPKSSSFSSANTDLDIFDSRTLLEKSKLVNMSLCYENSKLLLGIDKEKLSILKLLQKQINCRESGRDILIVLRKIKVNDSFAILGLYFGPSASQVAKIFNETLPKIARCFKTLIFKPSKEVIHRNLPVAFRANYFMVSEIIDAFELGIEKPSNPVHQSLTWSDYKQQNTLKVLISCTPDGFINYVSKAYGGRISDLMLAMESGYVEKLQENTTVLADRGFKHIETELADRKCKLLRPPSVASEGTLTEEESLLTKQVAALRIHIERVIGRVREFAVLTPHCCIDHNLVGRVDDIVVVAAGLSNLQNKITRF